MEYKHADLAYITIIPFFLWCLWYFKTFKKAELIVNSRLSGQRYSYLRLFNFFLGAISFFLIGFSLMGPRLSIGTANLKLDVRDIFFVVDVSRSMEANDFPPNRLEVAKRKIKEFIKMAPADRIGIIMFSEEVFTLLPLSTDLKLIDKIVDEIQMGPLGSGTNIGDAVGLAVARSIQSLADKKVIILLTDGVSNVGNITPIQAAEKAKEQGIKVYGIGIGGNPNANIGVTRGSRRRMRIPGGSVDFSTLDQIAEITGGKSFTARNGDALSSVFTEIQKLEKTKIDSVGRIIYKELFLNYLLSGIILFLICDLFKIFLLREIL